MNIMPEMQFMTKKQIIHHLCISETTLWRMIKRGEFPAGIKIGQKKLVWPVEQVKMVLEKKREKN